MKQALRDARHTVRSAARENAWLLPAFGALVGVLLAYAVRNVGRTPDPAVWAITVDRARDTLMGALAIVFTGLSIVLALTAVSAQNAASRFSLRLLRLNQRGLREKTVIAAFTMATAFIISEQVGLRALPPDDLAPRGGLMLAVIMVLLSGATIIWYISASMKSFRLDRTLQRVGRQIRRTLRTLEHSHRDESSVPASTLNPPPGATPIAAARSGYLANVDTPGLYQLATEFGVVVGVDIVIGSFVVSGQKVGWVSSEEGSTPPPPNKISATIAIVSSRDPAYDVAYGMTVLVDIAIMALSPAVNDPYTAVEVVNELTLVLVAFVHHEPGPRGRTAPDGRCAVAVAGRSLGDYLTLATRQILLYGREDPEVTAALLRLATAVEAAATSEPDREASRALASRVRAEVRGQSST